MHADRANPFDGSSANFGVEASTECTICFERMGDHVLLPCGHSGYCGGCAQSLFRSSAEGISCGQCPVCRAPLTAVVRVPVDTPVGSSGNILEVSAGGFADGGGGAIIGSPRAPQDANSQNLDLLGPKYTVNPIAELSTSHTVEVEEEDARRIAAGRGRGSIGDAQPLGRTSADGVPKEDSSMAGVASFIVWEELASEAGTSGSRGSLKRDEDRKEGERGALANQVPSSENNPIEFW